MSSQKGLPYNEAYFSSAEQYVDSLLNLVSTDEFLRTLCGGVHILDFFTSDPDLYSRVIPQEWRTFFARHPIMALLDMFIRDDLDPSELHANWDDVPLTLVDYIQTIRKHLLDRQPKTDACNQNGNDSLKPTLARHVAVGMTVKKRHEVGIFASYIDDLASRISGTSQRSVGHLVDFGSGQNYLGRALASEPFNRNIVAIESKASNAEKARDLDVKAKLTTKQRLMRNKKAFRAASQIVNVDQTGPEDWDLSVASIADVPSEAFVIEERPTQGSGKIKYVEHIIEDSDLSDIMQSDASENPTEQMVISLHSCGNLVHHGLRSLTRNPSVKAVAMVGCCYNLITERLGPATYKLPELRPERSHPRLEKEANAYDPHGFPMSNRLCEYQPTSPKTTQPGLRLNITARMMAVQAPQNWGEDDSTKFFTRHFYRALLQKIFLDRGVVGPPRADCVGGASPAGHGSGGTPIVIGSLRKACYTSFVNYVRGAITKLVQDPVLGSLMTEKMSSITDEAISAYEQSYAERQKDLSVVWSLMAFSAGVIEATIVADRWLWLTEQEEVAEAWVEPVFEYSLSPRNLVVVGIKK